MIASAECVSGAVDSQNAAIYDGIPGAAGSVHLQDAPNSPVVRDKIRHENDSSPRHALPPTIEHSTEPYIDGTISGS